MATPPWETVRDACQAEKLTPGSDAGMFRFASAMVPVGPEFAAYARQDFPPGRPVLVGVIALTARIFDEFKFDPRATDVATPVAEVLRKRAGVCQDFAHLMIACLRSLGLPARYVSGYLETAPPPGQKRLVGADASHAWVSVFCGDDAGWVDADPTNNLLPGERHITVAWGRDFADVSPLRGVTLGAGGQRLEVAVDVLPEGE
jgi:transglutaminase-like putative cysteine protease